MALSAAKLEYFRAYREAHRDAARAACKRSYVRNKERLPKQLQELTLAKKRLYYHEHRGNLEQVAKEKALIESIRLSCPANRSGAPVKYSDSERIAQRKIVVRRARYKHVKGVPTFEDPGVCEVCGGTSKISMDHDHRTSTFRGWLCDDCNVALGKVKDDVSILQRMIDYLERKVQVNA